MANEVQIKKKRTKGTVLMTLELIRGTELTDLMTDIFLMTKDVVAKELIRRYEYQIIEAFENPEAFEKNLHTFYRETASYIKKNKLYKEFYAFCYFVFSNLSVKRREKEGNDKYENALNTYYNLLLQQMNYFVPHPKLAYGLKSNGQLMLCSEPYPNLDVVLMDAEMAKNMDIQKVYAKYQRIGYDIRSERDFQVYHANDQLITNMLLVMSCLINEETKRIHSDRHYRLAQGISLPAEKVDNDTYLSLLKEKRYFLPKQGVQAHYKHMGEIAIIDFMETFYEDRIILLYKATALDGTCFSGFYDTKLDYLYTPWESTDMGRQLHERMCNIVLESYAYLTTDIDEKLREKKIERRLYLEGEAPILSAVPFPTVSFLYEEKKERVQKKGEDTRLRLFNKRNYKESKTTIHPFVRKLPAGATASEEAIALAKEYHYVLREDETFVRPFERSTYRLK